MTTKWGYDVPVKTMVEVQDILEKGKFGKIGEFLVVKNFQNAIYRENLETKVLNYQDMTLVAYDEYMVILK